MITLFPSNVRADASALVIFRGQPNRSLDWRLTGSGTLTPISNRTNANGTAGAKYVPGNVGDTVTIEVESGS